MSDFISKNICPITHTPVDEIYKTSTPVLAPDGWTYNKEALVKWLTSHGNSPVTRQPMTISQLIVNRALIPDTVPDSPTSSEIKFVLSAGLDNSASMGEEAEIVNSNGKRERHGLSQLDLAKHSLVCVVNSLDETSMFGLVVWSTSAEIVLPLTKMDISRVEKRQLILSRMYEQTVAQISGTELKRLSSFVTLLCPIVILRDARGFFQTDNPIMILQNRTVR